MKWLVMVRVTVERVYEVEAEDEKEARDASVYETPISEIDVDEETLSIVPMKERAS